MLNTPLIARIRRQRAASAVGTPFLVATSTGTSFPCGVAVLSSTGVVYNALNNVLSSSGTSYIPI